MIKERMILEVKAKSENLLCDIPYHLDEIEQNPLALCDLEDQLLVIEEQIVQVLTREDGAHRFIEALIWKTQMEERQKGVASGVTSAIVHNQRSTRTNEIRLLAVVHG
jgi:hypothetical protein